MKYSLHAKHYPHTIQVEGLAAAKRAARKLANHLNRSVSVVPVASKRPKPKRRKKASRNPSRSSGALAAAKRLYSDFRGDVPRRISKVRMPPTPKAMLTIGETIGIMYRTNRDGKVENYLHKFRKKARPALAVSSDGRNLYLLGGAYRVTEKGIEDDA